MTRFFQLICLLFALTTIYNRPGYGAPQEPFFSKSTSFNLADPEASQSAGALLLKKEKRHFFGIGLLPQFAQWFEKPYEKENWKDYKGFSGLIELNYWYERQSYRLGVNLGLGGSILTGWLDYAIMFETYYLAFRGPTSLYVGGGFGVAYPYAPTFRFGIGAEMYRNKPYRLLIGLSTDARCIALAIDDIRWIWSIGPRVQFLF